ncbi:MAG TPA: SH3 domain-containing C40 family peptidase [Verrucomicrobiales bacterium]|nr:SH3 domain-containing C40 family peptidase [Verrucomicrobiales bacterium]
MPFAVCRLSLVPVRLHPDHVSEMTTQVRGGEAVEILETQGQYWRVRVVADGYGGWVTSRQFTVAADAAPPAATVFTDDLCGEAVRDDARIILPLGSPLPGYDGGKFQLGTEWWTWAGKTRTAPDGPPDKAELLSYARRFLHTPYHWGGRTLFGIDCSGFMQAVFKAFGVQLLRDSKQQATQGTPVAGLSAAVPGDLVFFGSQELGIYHVGLLLPCSEIIHSSTMVRVDDLFNEGIRNRETGQISHRIETIRRVL